MSRIDEKIEKYFVDEEISLDKAKWTRKDKEGYIALEAQTESGQTIYPIKVSERYVPRDFVQKIENLVMKNKDRIG